LCPLGHVISELPQFWKPFQAAWNPPTFA
jgi:hypothetical protein